MEGLLRYLLEDDSSRIDDQSPSVRALKGSTPSKVGSMKNMNSVPQSTEHKPLKKERSRSPRKAHHGMIVEAKANAMQSSAAGSEDVTRSQSQLSSLTRVSSFKKSSPSPLRRFSSNSSLIEHRSSSKTELKRKTTISSDSSTEPEDGEPSRVVQEEATAYFKLTETHLFFSVRQMDVCTLHFL